MDELALAHPDFALMATGIAPILTEGQKAAYRQRHDAGRLTLLRNLIGGWKPMAAYRAQVNDFLGRCFNYCTCGCHCDGCEDPTPTEDRQ